MSCRASFVTALLALELVFNLACNGIIGEPGSDLDPPSANVDAGTPPPGTDGGPPPPPPPPSDCSEEQLASLEALQVVLSERCAGCHAPRGRQHPDLANLGVLLSAESRQQPETPMVVPFAPEESWLYQKVADTPSTGLLMPLGAESPDLHVRDTIGEWIALGAVGACREAPPPPIVETPPHVPQDVLFTCTDPDVPSATPGRFGRIERLELVQSVGGFDNPDWPATRAMPFAAPSGAFSTYAARQGIDETQLAILLDTLPGAIEETESGTFEERCIRRDSAPDETCRDDYVSTLLERRVLFRPPRPEERTSVRATLDDEIAAEAEESGDLRDIRRRTLQRVRMAAWLLPDALLRSEEGDASGRLTASELRQVLAHALSDHPSLATSRPELAWLPAFDAAFDGADAMDDALRRSFVRDLLDRRSGWVGGIDPRRDDLLDVYANERNRHRLERRGDHWLAPRVAAFFREYFDYGELEAGFRDEPSATSRWSAPRTRGLVRDGYQRMISSDRNGLEPRLLSQLDDMIARAVLDAEREGGDVFGALLTSRLYRVPSTNVSGEMLVPSGVPCDPSLRDTGCTGGTHCVIDRREPDGTWVGFCSDSRSWQDWANVARVYDLDGLVEDDDAARWVEMPEGTRSGVLTHPAWLAAHGANFEDDASAIYRGRWIREHLLCEDVPGLENVEADAVLVPQDEDDPVRARDRLHETFYAEGADPTCQHCHDRMNSLGLPFEIYNHAGFARANDHGLAPDGSSRIALWPVSEDLEGFTYREVVVDDAVELAATLAEDPFARRCFVRHVFRYFMGRDEVAADACTLAAMESAFEGGSFFALLEALFSSDTFLMRQVEG